MRNTQTLFLALVAFPLFLAAQPTEVYYLRANINEPWCCGWAPYPDANPTGLNAVFGVGGWTLAYYETATAATIFDSGTCYVYMEGGDGHANEMETFFNTNQALIESYVSNGGSLFLNAAPNEGNGMSYGFGGVWLWYPYWWSGSVVPAPGMATHPIYVGPFTPITTSYTGTSFTHAYTSGGSVTHIINDASYTNYPALTYKTWGAGTVFFGGMTTASWHYPSTEAANLRKNMHSYLSGLCALVLPIEFTSFRAEPDETVVRVDWEIQDQENALHYTVERSVDGIEWEQVAVVNAEEGMGTTHSYTVIDTDPVIGKSYYQVKMTMDDGHWGYSPVDDVELKGDLTVYPVPAHDVVFVQANGIAPQAIFVHDASGRRVEVETCSTNGITALRIADLTPGIYSVTCVRNNTPDTRTFIKQ